MQQFVNLLDAPYSRRGSYFAFANDNLRAENVLGMSNLWLCNCRSVNYAMTDLTRPNNYRQVLLQPVKDGKALPAFLNTTAEEVIIETAAGKVRFCIAEKRCVLARTTDGLTLRISPRPDWMGGQISVQVGSGRHDVEFGTGRLRVTAIRGDLRRCPGALELVPDADGVAEAAFEDYLAEPLPREADSYPAYDEGVAAVKAEFDDFCAHVCPALPEEFEPMRRQALWQTWSMMVEPDGESDYRRPMVKMIHSIFESAFGWQMPMQAVWLHNDPKLAWEVFCSCFEHQDAAGRLSDAVGFRDVPGKPAMKPPIHGLALLWLLDHGVIDAAAPDEADQLWLLNRLAAWTEYIFTFRSGRGMLCVYQRPLETGWEDAPQYRLGMPQISPDLNAFLALDCEAIARFGANLGMPESIRRLWLDRSEQIVAEMVEQLWDGERWHSLCVETGARSENDNLTFCLPALLGKRLPKDVLDKTVAGLLREGAFKTPYGYASEALDSPYLRHGFSAGSVITPTHFFVPMLLEENGYAAEAKDAALSYCRTLKRCGFFHICNALTGREDRSLTAFGEKQLFWSAWTSSCYFFLADRYGK